MPPEKKKGPQTKIPDPPPAPVPGKRPPRGPRSNIATSKGEVTVQGLVMKEWMKTPQSLLLDFCKREKRPNPRFDQLSGGGRDGIRFRCVLQDPKRPGTDKDLIFVPSSGFNDELDAKHTIALLALHSVEGDRQYETKLPEPYRTLWMQLSAAKAGAGSGAGGPPKKAEKDDKKGAKAGSGAGAGTAAGAALPAAPIKRVARNEISMDVRLTVGSGSVADKKKAAADREMRRRKRDNDRAARMEAIRSRHAESVVFMSAGHREAVEAVLRDLRLSAAPSGAGAEGGEDSLEAVARALHEPSLAVSDDAVEECEAELEAMGFTPEQAQEGAEEGATAIASGAVQLASGSTSVTSGDVVSAALDWLMLHTPEHLLPRAFDPRGKNELRLGNAASAAPLPTGAAASAVAAARGRSAPAASAAGGSAAAGADRRAPEPEELSVVPPTAQVPREGAASPQAVRCAAVITGGAVGPTDAGRAAAEACARVAACGSAISVSDDEVATLARLVAQTAVLRRVAPALIGGGALDSCPLLLGSAVPCADPIGACGQEVDALGAIYGGGDCSVTWAQAMPAGLAAALGRGKASAAITAVQALGRQSGAPDASGGWEDAADADAAAGSGPLPDLDPSSPFTLAWRTLSLQLGEVPLEGGKGRGKGAPLCLQSTALVIASRAAVGCGPAEEVADPTPLAAEEAGIACDALPPALTSAVYPSLLPLLTLTAPGTPQRALLGVTARLLEHALGTAAAPGAPPLFHASSSGSGSGGASEACPLLYDLASWCTSGAPAAAAGDLSKLVPTAREAAVGSGVGGITAGVGGITLEGSTAAAASAGAGGKGGRGGHANTAAASSTSGLYRRPRLSAALEAQMARDDAAWAEAAKRRAGGGGPDAGGYASMQAVRRRLPVWGYREAIVELVRSHQVVLLSGETGCGKTTQVPQFLLEDAIARGQGGHARIVVTQPRRIAAIGVAQRVAAERGEPLGTPGGAVGYQIRGERRAHAGTPLLFTTTGVLLRRLAGGGLGHVTTIIVDEVHERGVDTDFLLAVLRYVLPHRPDLRVVCMSATMDAGAFARYFGGIGACTWPQPQGRAPPPGTPLPLPPGACASSGAVVWRAGDAPVISVPGFTHPVREVYLEEIVRLTGHVPRVKGVRQAQPPEKGEVSAAAAAAAADDPEEEEEEEGEEGGGATTPSPGSSSFAIGPHDWKRHGLDFGVIAALIRTVVAGRGAPPPPPAANGPAPVQALSGGGAVLVFLPGVPEIRKLHRELERGPGGCGGMHVLHLHGALSAEEQARVFGRPPGGSTKVVLATNVAETSITIDDCVCVIDSLRVKEAGFDHVSRLARLQEGWVSQAAAKQRRGRAGRVRPGVCYRVEPAAMHALLAPAGVPEIQRTPLEGLILQVKVMRLGAGTTVRGFMRGTLDPPSDAALAGALRTLADIGAVTAAPGGSNDVELTPLGYHLAALPLDVRLGKALLYGALLRAVDPLLTVTAALADRSPWRPLPPSMDPGERAGILSARAKLEWGCSDHLALVRAFNGWRDAKGASARRAFCDAHGLSHEGMRGISDLRGEYAGTLADLGFLPGKGRRGGGRGGEVDGEGEYDDGGDGATTVTGASSITAGAPSRGAASSSSPDSWGRFGELSPALNACAGEVNVVRAALVAGLYPNLAKIVTPPRRYHETAGGAMPAPYAPRDIRYYTLREPEAGGGAHSPEVAAVLAAAMGQGGTKPQQQQQQQGAQRAGGKKAPAVGGNGRRGGDGAAAAAGDGGGGSDSSDSESGAPEEDEGEKPDVEVGGGRAVLVHRGWVQDRVFLHPSSFLFSVGEFRCPWVVFCEKSDLGAGSKVTLRDASMVSSYALLLFGGPLTVHHREGVITLGGQGWVRFHAEPRIGVLVKGLRAALSRLLAHKIAAPGADVSGHPVVDAITRLLIGNGS